MKTSRDLARAIGWATNYRRVALRMKRDFGNPRNPNAASPGSEKEFADARDDVRALDLILKLLDKEAQRERRERMRGLDIKTAPLRRKVARVLERALDVLICVGLCLLGTLGIAALAALRYPDTVVRITAVAGVAYIIARDIFKRRARK